jgi:hypothetical protein
MKFDLTNIFDLLADPLSRHRLLKDFQQEVFERILGDEKKPVKKATVLEVITPAPNPSDNPNNSNEQYYAIRAKIENVHESLPDPVDFIKQKKTNKEINKLVDCTGILYSLNPIASTTNPQATTSIPRAGDIVEVVEIKKGVYRFNKRVGVVRELIGFIKNEDPAQLDQPAVVDPNSAQGSFRYGKPYNGPPLSILTKVGAKYYIGKQCCGVTPDEFWSSFRTSFEAYINVLYPELGLKVGNLGVTRDLVASVNPSSSARVAGSKHGSGLGQDLYLHTTKYGEYTYYKEDNKKLAKDEKLVTTIREFMKTRPDLTWGGDFGGGTGVKVADRGILEFHHFEVKNHLMPPYFEPFKEDIKESGYGDDISKITSSKELSKLYKHLLNTIA